MNPANYLLNGQPNHLQLPPPSTTYEAITNTILQNQRQLFDNIKVVLETQQLMMAQLAELSTKIDKLPKPVVKNNNAVKEPKSTFVLEPVATVEQLDDLEKILSKKEEKINLMRKYRIMCTRGTDGITCAYTLIDKLFTREFLTKCSWAGGTRGGGVKIALKMYKNILNFFFEMVHGWDSRYSIQENDAFLKGVLRNAIRRKESKLERASTRKHRRKTGRKTLIEQVLIDNYDETSANEEQELSRNEFKQDPEQYDDDVNDDMEE